MRKADDDFTKRFEATRQPLQLFERNYENEMSMRWLIYEHGAHEAAFQMLGSPERDDTFGTRLKSAGGMEPVQMAAVREGFKRGEAAAAARIRLGLPVLSAAAAGAPFLGLLGLVWILMRTFSSDTAATEGIAAVSPGVSGGLAVMVVALLVATPAIFGQILISAKGRERLRELIQFREDVLRLMDRFYATSAPAHHSRERSPEEINSVPFLAKSQAASFTESEDDAKVETPIETAFVGFVQDEMPLQEFESPFEAVEEGFVEPEVEVPLETEVAPILERETDRGSRFKTPFSEPEINPIAQQTAGLLANGAA
jgi:biopolymer transport protein ExbB/TolQ